jgi:hypothetical protein
MVLRAILRNVQNTLVLSSAFLVILALQRLQHYEFRADAFRGRTTTRSTRIVGPWES